jgi:uncharacterized protein (DUF1778 family)
MKILDEAIEAGRQSGLMFLRPCRPGDRGFRIDAWYLAKRSLKGLLTAQQMMEKLALAEAQKAAEAERRRAAAEAEKKALIDKLSKPPDITEEERIKRAAAIIERAVANCMTEVQVMRFPNSLCTDHGRAINQGEPGWEDPTGLPKEMYSWVRQLRPLGYKVHCQIVEFLMGYRRHRYHVEMGVDCRP